MAKRSVRYVSFQNETKLKKPRMNRGAVVKLAEGKNKEEIVEIMLDKTGAFTVRIGQSPDSSIF